jgi:hypothetical protein
MLEKLKGHVSETLEPYLNDIEHHYIKSENPEDHWNFLDVKNHIVLDLGCGFHLIEKGWMTTPEYFIHKGANKIIGIDTERSDIQKLQEIYPNHSFFTDRIHNLNQLKNYIETYNVTCLKMDIEGDEQCYIDSNEKFPSLKNVAIETHNRTLLNKLLYKLLRDNFTIQKICTFYPRVYDVCNLVYASRP